MTCLTAAALTCCSFANAGAVERSLLGVHIYANVKTVLRKFGNPNYVLTAGQTFDASSNTVSTTVPTGGASVGPLPGLQPDGGPVPAFGTPQLPQNDNSAPAPTAPSNDGEVTLVYEKPNGLTYQFLLSPSGSVLQITALGYQDSSATTSRGVTFGTSLTQLENRYGYPENQPHTNADKVMVVDYSKKAHVAFELLDNTVVGIVVAAID